MDETLKNVLLVLCGLGAFILLIILYVWYFMFGRSLQAVLMTGITILLNRDSKVDINAPVNITKRPEQAKLEIKAKASAVDFDSAFNSNDKYIPYIPGDEEEELGAQVVDPQAKKSFVVSTSPEKNRFRRIADIVSYPFSGERWHPHNENRNENINSGSDSSDLES